MLPYLTGTVRVTSPYGRRVLFGRSEMHRGIDLVGDPADKTVCAVADGVIGRSLVVTDPANRTSEWGGICAARSCGRAYGVLLPPVA